MAELFEAVSEDSPWEWAKKRRKRFTSPWKDSLGGAVLGVVAGFLMWITHVMTWRRDATVAILSGAFVGVLLPLGETLWYRLRRNSILKDEELERLRCVQDRVSAPPVQLAAPQGANESWNVVIENKGIRRACIERAAKSGTYSEVVVNQDSAILFSVRREPAQGRYVYQADCRLRAEYEMNGSVVATVNDAPWLNQDYNRAYLQIGDEAEAILAIYRLKKEGWIALDDQRRDPSNDFSYMPRILGFGEYVIRIEVLAHHGSVVLKRRLKLDLQDGNATWAVLDSH